MPSNIRDRLTGLIILAAALVWIGLVIWTVPVSQDSSAGARAFPLWFGVALAVLSALLILQSFIAGPVAEEDAAHGDVKHGLEAWVAVSTASLLAAYGFLLEKIGFMPATALAVAAIMTVVLRIVRPVLVLAMAIGLAIGCFVVFGKLLGAYLPPGTWITFNI